MKPEDLIPHLHSTSPPWLLIGESTVEDAKWIPAVRYGKQGLTPVIRVLRGGKMTSHAGLMNEFGAAFQFFEGFGENWNALNECLCYMDEWLPGDGYITEVADAHRVLSDEDDDNLVTFLKILDRMGGWWKKPITDNPPHNRPGFPYHVVFKCPPSELAEALVRYKSCAPRRNSIEVISD